MSLWDEGYLKHGKLMLSPHTTWSRSLLSCVRTRTEKYLIWFSAFHLLASLLLVLSFSAVKAHASDEDTRGEGLFALSLEEALDIDVTATEHLIPSKDGVYTLASHELLRLYSQPEEVEAFTNEHSQEKSHRAFPVLFRGSYLGTFNDLRSALRFIQKISGKELRVDLYLGSHTVWFEDGHYPALIDIRDGVDPSVLEMSVEKSEGAEVQQSLQQNQSEVLP